MALFGWCINYENIHCLGNVKLCLNFNMANELIDK